MLDILDKTCQAKMVENFGHQIVFLAKKMENEY